MRSEAMRRLASRRKHWLLRRDKSTFVDWQRVKVQELSEQVRAISGRSGLKPALNSWRNRCM